jgi:hypothetical protein
VSEEGAVEFGRCAGGYGDGSWGRGHDVLLPRSILEGPSPRAESDVEEREGRNGRKDEGPREYNWSGDTIE